MQVLYTYLSVLKNFTDMPLTEKVPQTPFIYFLWGRGIQSEMGKEIRSRTNRKILLLMCHYFTFYIKNTGAGSEIFLIFLFTVLYSLYFRTPFVHIWNLFICGHASAPLYCWIIKRLLYYYNYWNIIFLWCRLWWGMQGQGTPWMVRLLGSWKLCRSMTYSSGNFFSHFFILQTASL